MKFERNWGYYEILKEGPLYQVKQLNILPGHGISYQYHHHRNEHWVNVRGFGELFIDGNDKILKENEAIYIPKLQKHKLFNPGKIELIIIETQTGEYLGEDDIVRIK